MPLTCPKAQEYTERLGVLSRQFRYIIYNTYVNYHVFCSTDPRDYLAHRSPRQPCCVRTCCGRALWRPLFCSPASIWADARRIWMGNNPPPKKNAAKVPVQGEATGICFACPLETIQIGNERWPNGLTWRGTFTYLVCVAHMSVRHVEWASALVCKEAQVCDECTSFCSFAQGRLLDTFEVVCPSRVIP